MNLYEILGVDTEASLRDIKKAFHKMAKRYHPDINKNKNSEHIFKEINKAYEILSDPVKRKAYDFEIKGIILNEYEFMNENFKINIDFENIVVNEIPQAKGGDVYVPITLTLKEAYKGLWKGVKYQYYNEYGLLVKTIVNLPIKKGVVDNQILKFEKYGSFAKDNPNRDSRGDVVITIHITDYMGYVVDCDDLRTELTISKELAESGGGVDFTTLDDRKLELKIPVGVKDGAFLILDDEGFPAYHTGNKGRLVIRLKVV